MKLSQYVTTLFCILCNIIVFLCPISAQKNTTNWKKLSFFAFAHIDIYFYNIFLFLKELKKKIIINKNNQADTTSVQTVNKNKKQSSNMLDANNQVLNQSLKLSKLLSYLRLKDAQATQNLISHLKQHFIPLEAMVVVYQALLTQSNLSCIKACSDDLRRVMTITEDKCAFLYPFVSKNHCSLYIF